MDATIQGHLKIGGINNTFRNTELPLGNLTDNGYGNYLDLESFRSNWSTSRKYSPIPYRETVGKLDGSFLLSGNASTPYLNASDLVTTCQDWEVAISGQPTVSAQCVSDPTGTEYSKSYAHAVMSSGVNFNSALGTSDAALWPVGMRFPQTKVYVVEQARCEGTSSCTVPYGVIDQTASTFLASCSANLTSSWTLVGGPRSPSPCLMDLSGVPAGHVLAAYNGSPSAGSPTAVDTAMVAFEPVPDDTVAEVLAAPNMASQLGIAGLGVFGTGSTLNIGGYASVVDTTSPTGYSATLFTSSVVNFGNHNLNAGGQFQPVPSAIAMTVETVPAVTDTLSAALTTASTTMTVTTGSTSTWVNNGCFMVDQEAICYSGTPTVGTTSFTISRGQFGTAAQAHNSGAILSSTIYGQMQMQCNGVNEGLLWALIGPSWTTFSTPFAAQNCNGSSLQMLFFPSNNVPTGQNPKMAAFTITPVNAAMSGTTGSIGGSALTAGQCTSGSVGITGVATNMAVEASPVTYPGDGMAWRAYVSSANSVTVKVCADVAGTPAASAYNVRVLQ